MPEFWFAIPGDPDTLTGGYVYARRLMQALPATGWIPRPLRWPESFPYPSNDDLSTVRRSLDAVPPGAAVMIDGLAFGALPADILATSRHHLVALVHHPLALETGIVESDAARLLQSERAALGYATRVVVTSTVTADTLVQTFSVPRGRIHIALPGTDPAPRAVGGGAVPLILAVGTLTPRKGHDILIAALSQITELPWTCRIVGSKTRDRDTVASLQRVIESLGLSHRINLAGEMNGEALGDAYQRADIFALASRYEGYGMVFAEALARGLPIVACAAGAVPATVPSDAGILVPPDDISALSGALRRVISDQVLRASLAGAAWRHGQTLPQWHDTAAVVSQALASAAEAAA